MMKISRTVGGFRLTVKGRVLRDGHSHSRITDHPTFAEAVDALFASVDANDKVKPSKAGGGT